MNIVDDVIKDMGIHVLTDNDHDPRYGMMPGDRCLYKHGNYVVICNQIWGGWFYGTVEINGDKDFMCGVNGLKKI